MSKNTSKLGKLGEDIACGYLVKKGYMILGRNYREKWDEIDIIARAKDQTLVFVEVKTAYATEYDSGRLMPEDNLTAAKLKKLRRACLAFAAKNPGLFNERRGWRIDLLALEVNDNLANEESSANKIRHYENI